MRVLSGKKSEEEQDGEEKLPVHCFSLICVKKYLRRVL